MLISDYTAFVQRTDVSESKPHERFDIALYGLAGEVGSLVAAVKKRLLAAGRRNWNLPNDEIIEELGDSVWYCFALGQASDNGDEFVVRDVRGLIADVEGEGDRGERIRQVLAGRAADFLHRAPDFISEWDAGTATLDGYQRLAFLTSRTTDDKLVEVCLAVLQQLMAELFRALLPDLEKELNQRLPDRAIDVVLGETIWHLSALASLYKLDLSAIAARNMEKLERRFGRGKPTPLKDFDRPSSEQLPRRFEIAFVTIAPGRSRMYMDGRRLGDDLTDNAYTEDGYRFHDVMHLALTAKLGWSPVLRKLIGRKRRSDARLDEVEDGARAAIVEETVIKAIHAEGVRLAALAPPAPGGDVAQLFANGADISFGFLRRLETLVLGLEVERNHYWEWEDAIVEGFQIFHHLRSLGQGTVIVDLETRSLTLVRKVLVDIRGETAGVGMASVSATSAVEVDLDERELELVAEFGLPATLGRKRAILHALGFDEAADTAVRLDGWSGDMVSIRAGGIAREAMWNRRIVAFRAAAVEDGDRTVVTALGIADD